MANFFTEMGGASGGGGVADLTPEQLATIRGLRQTGHWTGANTGGNLNGVQQWYDPTVEGNNGWRLQYQPGVRFGGPNGSDTLDPSQDQNWITKVREDTGGKLGDRWDMNGKYLGTFDAQDGGGRGMNQAVALIAGGYFGGQYLNGLDSAATGVGGTAATSGMSAAEQIAFLSANGMTDAAIVQAYPALASAGGLTGVGGGLATTAAGGANWLDTAKQVYSGANEFLGSGIGKALTTGVGLGLMKDVKTGDPTNIQAVGDNATTRANANDDYFNSTFMPQYLALMQQAQARDREMYDFNMGRARLAAGQMDKFYQAVDDYDNEGNRTKMRGEAVATARQSNNTNVDINRRRMQSMGINPNSGAYGAMMGQMGARSALLEAQAANMVEGAAKKEGINLRAQAAGLRGADQGYVAGALSGAGFGMNAVGAAQNGWQGNNSGWNATTGLGLDAQRTLYNGQGQANAANASGWNGLIGYGMGQLWNRGG